MINAGIDANQKDQALEIIQEQIAEMQKGNISEHELEQTKQGLITSMNGAKDSPAAFINRNLIGLVNSELRTSEQVVAAIKEVTHDDVVSAINRLKLDTTYILSGNGREEQ